MSQFVRKFVLLAVVIATVAVMAHGAVPAKAQKTIVTWFVGLGTGTQDVQKAPQEEFVKKFNASQDKIELQLTISPINQTAKQQLGTMIASGNAPDIVGPVGFGGANDFLGQWLDLKPLVEKTKYDLKQFPQSLIDIYTEPDGKLVGIPFAAFPGLLFYNKALFDDAELAYPPAKFGEKYKLDGKEVDWDYDTVAEVAKRLTFDANGKSAAEEGFDPTKIVQFGFNHQYDTIRSDFATFGGAPVVNASGKVEIAEAHRAEAKWLWNAIWKEHFAPSKAYRDTMQPNEFASGKLAMARTMLWFNCCVGELKTWDLGVQPAYKGTVYAPADLDTFRITKDTKHPDEAFTVLSYMLGEGALDLLTVYTGYPARPDLQDQFIKILAEKYPFVKNWDVIPASMEHAVAPHHESGYPNFTKGQSRFDAFAAALYAETGKDLDIDKELDTLQSDLQKIVDEEPAPLPTLEATMEATAAS